MVRIRGRALPQKDCGAASSIPNPTASSNWASARTHSACQSPCRLLSCLDSNGILQAKQETSAPPPWPDRTRLACPTTVLARLRGPIPTGCASHKARLKGIVQNSPHQFLAYNLSGHHQLFQYPSLLCSSGWATEPRPHPTAGSAPPALYSGGTAAVCLQFQCAASRQTRRCQFGSQGRVLEFRGLKYHTAGLVPCREAPTRDAEPNTVFRLHYYNAAVPS